MANTLEIIIKATDKASKEIGSVSKGVKGLGDVVGVAFKGLAIGAGLAVTAIGAVGGALTKLAVDALPLQGISDAFEGITGAHEEMLAELRKGSLGMVTDRELMRNYNQAAQLVSKTFADQLPDAMKYLAKVSAATGQDMGFMLDSLTKGVGRMSPMILDNLGIQVSLADATAEAAEMFGVEADALTKTQLQAGMMNVVMRALEKNTAAMPEIAGTAAQRWAALGVTFKNVKDQIGLAFIPILERMMGIVETLTTRFLPPLVDWFTNKLAPGIGEAWDRISQFITDIGNGEQLTTATRKMMQNIFDPDVIQYVINVERWVQAFVRAVKTGDWSAVGAQLWEQIVIGVGKASLAAEKLADFGKNMATALREALAKSLGLEEYIWDEFGTLVRGDTSWAAIGAEIWGRIVSGFGQAKYAGSKMIDSLRVSIGAALGMVTEAYQDTAGNWIEDAVGWEDIGKEIWTRVSAGMAAAAKGASEIGKALEDSLRTSIAGALGMSSTWNTDALREGVIGSEVTWDAIGSEISRRLLAGMVAYFKQAKADYDAIPTAMIEWSRAPETQTKMQQIGSQVANDLMDGFQGATIDRATAWGGTFVERLKQSFWANAGGLADIITLVNLIGGFGKGFGGSVRPFGDLQFETRASGGWASGLTMVGERGPELVNLPRGSYVHSNEESQAMAGPTVNFAAGSIVINNPRSAEDVQIGVMRGLRAAGVMY